MKSFQTGLDKATIRNVAGKCNELSNSESIKEMADDLAKTCVFCFFQGKPFQHKRCHPGSCCPRCLSSDHLSYRDCKNVVRLKKVCFVCYLPLKLHWTLQTPDMNDLDYGHQKLCGINCTWKETALNDNIKYWLLSIKNRPDSQQYKDIILITSKDIIKGYEENVEQVLRVLTSYSK